MLQTIPEWLFISLLVFATALVIMWLLLPFAMFGIKPLLKRMIEQQQRCNELLERLPARHAPADEPTRGRRDEPALHVDPYRAAGERAQRAADARAAGLRLPPT